MSRPKQEPAEPDFGDYTDYLLLSSSEFTQGWKHNILRLAPASGSDATDPHRWTSAKLNRRDMRRIRREEEMMARKAAEEAEAERLRAEGKEGEQGDVTMAPATPMELKPGMPGYMAVKKEKEERDESLVAPGPGGPSTATAKPRPRRGFGAPKKTRRVYITEQSSKERRIRFEEQHPWMLETMDDKKPPVSTRWIGSMDAAASATANGGEGSSYALFVLDNTPTSAAFKVLPANRWYRFSSRPRYHTMTPEEAEEEYQKMQKASDMDIWFAQRRANPSANAAGPSQTRSLNGSASNGSTGPGSYKGRFAQASGLEAGASAGTTSRLRTVVGEDSLAGDSDLFGDDEGTPNKSRKSRSRGPAGGDFDEFEFEEDFQDDEEGIGQVGDDALDDVDTKELEERIKREMRGANNFGEGTAEDEEDDSVATSLTKAGKRLKKILKKRKSKAEEDEGDNLFSDDEDEHARNPYATDQDEDDNDSEAEREIKRKEEAKKRDQQRNQYPGQNAQSGQSKTNSGPRYPGGGSVPLSRAPSTGPGSRAASPAPASPVNNLLRRATSPSGRESRAASPTPPPSASKRKADDSAAQPGTEGNGTKRRKPGSPSPPAVTPVAAGDDSALIARTEIIEYIKLRSPTTKDLLKHFKSAMARDPRNKDIILKVVKEVASIVEGKLAVRPEFV